MWALRGWRWRRSSPSRISPRIVRSAGRVCQCPNPDPGRKGCRTSDFGFRLIRGRHPKLRPVRKSPEIRNPTSLFFLVRRIKITIAYDGTDFHGWQAQPGLPTIQGTLERIIGDIEGKPVHVAGSGRTDAGVHAMAQVAAFSLQNPIPEYNLRKAINRLLPASVRVLSVEETYPDFHPRYDAVAKTYEYRIHRGEIVSPFEWRYAHHFPYPLDERAFIDAAPLLEGEHDYTAFAASDD